MNSGLQLVRIPGRVLLTYPSVAGSFSKSLFNEVSVIEVISSVLAMSGRTPSLKVPHNSPSRIKYVFAALDY